MNKPIAPESREMQGLIIFTQSRSTIINTARKTTRREETTKIHKWICFVKKRELRFKSAKGQFQG